MNKTIKTIEGKDIVLSRIIDAKPEDLYNAWTKPELIKKWFAPLPVTTPVVQLDVRPGGSSYIEMQGPNGEKYPCPGIYLEVIKNEKIVSTDAFKSAWEPSDKPFMTLVLTFDNHEGKTKYTARIKHWSIEDRDMHDKMGFNEGEGWFVCFEQLANLVENKS